MAFTKMKIEQVGILKTDLKYTRQDVESFIIIWLDVTINTNKYGEKSTEQLQMISNDFEIFNNSDACINYITNLKNERVLFIVSNTVDPCILTLAQDLPAISAVYILSVSNNDIQEKWSQSIRKVKGVYKDMNELIKQIKFDIRRIEHDLIGFEILEKSDISLSASRNLKKQEYKFMYTQLLKDVFLKFEDNSTSELAEYCREVYAENPAQLNIINEFERKYEANEAIWWYTKDSFLYKLISKALRTQHVETLYNMRTFIRHLHQHLIQLCPIVADHNQSTSILNLYRGQQMSINEFEKLKNKEGGFFSVSNFFSTSTNREIAFIYAGQSDGENVAIIFELTVGLNHNTNSSFACIEQFSYFKESEHEWLFSMGTVFRIGKIELLNNIWYINLTLTNDQDENLENLTKHMRKIIQMQRPNPLVSLCRLFARMSEYKKAIELCEKHASSENEWEMKATLYDTIALKYADEGDDNSALDYYERALDVVAKYVDKNNPLLASYHNNVAISCGLLCEDERAIEHYHNAIRLESNASEPDHLNIAYSYEAVGHILNYTYNQYNKALNYYQNALDHMLEHLSSAHPDTIALYDSMADAYEEQNKLDDALHILSISVDTMLTSAECNPRDLIDTYKHMTRIYKKLKKFEEASLMLKKCHEIEAANPSSKNFNLENVNIDALVAKIFRSDNTS